jgi:SAM-dependent methyltransferase
VDKLSTWRTLGAQIESQHDQIQFLSALEFIEKIDFSKIESLADIGSGPGHQAFVFKGKGVKVTCIDYKRPVYDIAWKHPDDTEDLQFDAIWSHHCLEHIPNPIEALIAWRKLLNPRGRLFLTVPEIGVTMSSGHLNNFNIPHLIYILAIAGFDCSSKCFKKSRSHLRASVIKSGLYNPDIEGLITSLSELAERKLFSPTICKAISDKGRFSISDVHLDWFGEKAQPANLSQEAYEYFVSSFFR